nr:MULTISPECIES: hypothetical protein [unclassified Bradyrhizobium]
MDTNPSNAIRPVTLGRENHLFAGSNGGGHRWAVINSLTTTCELNDIEPLLTKIANENWIKRLPGIG